MIGTETIKTSLNMTNPFVIAHFDRPGRRAILAEVHRNANQITRQPSLLSSRENHMIENVCSGPMPDGFTEKHENGTASMDEPGEFLGICRVEVLNFLRNRL